MKYTPTHPPGIRTFTQDDTNALWQTDAAIITQLIEASEGNTREWIHRDPERAAEFLTLCIDAYHQAIRKFLDPEVP